MRRLQIYMDDILDDRLEEQAVQRGLSKAALVRQAVSDALGPPAPAADDPWAAMVGWRNDDPVDDIDEVIYGGHG